MRRSFRILALSLAAATAAVIARHRRGTAPAGHGVSHRRRSARNVEVARLGTRLGTGAVTHRVKRARATSESARAELDAAYQQRATEQVAERLGQMKGALMKLGQMASYLDAGLPESVRQTLAQLQQDAPAMDGDVARWVVASELGRPADELFATWDDEPIAAASIGQVHKAITHDGRQVAVKVQYPGIDEAILADLDNSDLLGRMLAMLFPTLEPGPLVAELRERIGDELDYRAEAAAQQTFVEFYRDHPFIHVPSVHTDLSAQRVLTTDFVEGDRFATMLERSRAERDRAGEILYRFVFRSLYRLRVFNGDPHPGNYLFGADGRVTFLDFGLVRRFDQSELDTFGDLIKTMIAGEPAAFRRKVTEANLVSPNAPLDDDEVYDWFSHYYELVRHEGPVTITPEYASKTIRHTFDAKNSQMLKWANVPPSFALIQRINLGLFAIEAELGATADWRRIAEELWPWVDGPPATELGQQEAEWLARRGLAAG
ncbi:MAG: AarF/ABC1/UbiB kinase family protein [Acidimicrobiales bacterium]|nr:AarF/ABC1/UbiB kinase family protein [Acidimicrobiales bacterium]